MLGKGWTNDAFAVRAFIETGVRWGEFENLEPRHRGLARYWRARQDSNLRS
jgi:hypothetical protein